MATRKKASQAKAVQKKQAKKSLSPRKTTKPTQKKSTKTSAKPPRVSKPSRPTTKARTAEVARPAPQPGFPIVGIGASAGGLEAKQALEASERQQRSLAQMNAMVLNALPAHIALVDANGVILSVNEAWKRFATANVLEGANYGIGCNYITVCEQAHGDCAEEGQAVADGLRAVLAGTQKSFALEYPCHAPNKERWFQVMITPISETENAGAVVMHLNVTERRQAQEALEKEQQFIATILDTAGALVLVLDPEWRIVRFNRVCENLTGRNIEEMRGKSFVDLSVVSGEDAQEVKNLLLSFKGKQFPKSFESAWVDQNRQLHWIRWSNTVVTDKEGKTENIIATGIDITNRKQAERALSREQKFISAVLDTAGALVVVLDRRGKIVRFNRACEELTGYYFVDVQGKPLWDFLLPPEDIPAVKKVFQDLRKEERSNQFENHWITKDNKTRQIAWSNTILANDKGEVDYVIGIGIDATERRKAEQTIDRLLRQNELILHSVGEGIYGIDNSGKAIFFNHAAERLTGWNAEELLGKVIHPVLHHTKLDGTPYLWEECPIYFSLKKGETHQIATDIFWRKDDTHFPAEFTSTSIYGENGNIEGAVVTFNDITERKQAEDVLLSSETRLLEAQRIAHVGSWEFDVVDNVLSWSDEIYRIFEVDRMQFGVSYEAFLDAIHPEDRESVNKAYTESVKKMTPYEIVHRLLMPDGRVKYVHERCQTFYDHNGSPIRSIGTVQDITAQKQAETKIQESEERFQAFMNYSPAVAFLKNEQGQYVYVNSSFEKLLNKSSAGCLGKTDQQLFPPEVARIFAENDQRVLKTKEVLETEQATLDETGSVCYWWVMKFLIPRKTGSVQLGGVALDITVRKKAEEALEQRKAELQESQKMLQALGGKLISAQEDERRRISRELHDDMNQRLAVLAFNIQSTQKGVDVSSPIYQNLQKLYDGVSSLSDDVRHLAYQLHPSILDDLGLEVALRSFLNDFSKWEGIPVIFTATDLPVTLDQELASCLYRVAQECMRNVSRHAQATQINVKLIGVEGGVSLSIQDNGKGFEVKEKKSGKQGLGLIGMEERVRVVQGTYEVQSAPGQGTKITVWVPIKEAGSS